MIIRVPGCISTKFIRAIAYILIVCGSIGVAIFTATKVEAIISNQLANSEFERVQRQTAVIAIRSGSEILQTSVLPEREALDPTVSVLAKPTLRATRQRIRTEAQGRIIGKLEIPKANISAVVFEGIDSRTLLRGIGHLPQTALPGELGNFAVAGHRDTVFRNLRLIARGDTIRIVTYQREFQYVVTMIAVVAPDDTTLTMPTNEPTCTLITCFPFTYFGPAPKRFVVQARQR